MHLQFTPVTREVAVLGPGDLLITKEDDFSIPAGPGAIPRSPPDSDPEYPAVDSAPMNGVTPHLELV